MIKYIFSFVFFNVTVSLMAQVADSIAVPDTVEYGFNISGSADIYYRVGTNNAPSQTYLILENKKIGLGSFNCLMEYDQKRYGAIIHLAAGPRAEQFYNVDENEFLKYVRESYAYANITHRLKVNAGTMVAMPGYEVDEPNQNPLYSTSYLNTLTPAIYTGVWATYDLSSKWKVLLGGFNDTDRRIDLTKGKHLGMMLTFENNDLTASISNFSGQESYGLLNVTDVLLDYEVNEKNKWALEILHNYINQESVENRYYGINLYYTHAIKGSSELSFRAEYLHDKNGVGFGVEKNSLYGLTAGAKIRILDHFVFMPEVRFDASSKPTYINDIGDLEQKVLSLVLGMSYVFGSE